MLSAKTRNSLVGLTILLALAALMYGILLLGKTPTWTGLRPYTVTLIAPTANDVGDGAKVDLNGKTIGQVQSVTLQQDAVTHLVNAYLTLQIDSTYDIPANTSAFLEKPQLGTPSVSLFVGEAKGGNLKKDGKATLVAQTGESGLIPKAINDNLVADTVLLGKVAHDLHALLVYNTPEEVIAAQTQPAGPDRPVDNISTLVIRLNRTMASLEPLLKDATLQQQVRDAIGNLYDFSSRLKTTLGNVDAVVKNADQTVTRFGDTATQANATLAVTQKEILRVSEKLVDTLAQLQKSTHDLTAGDGTTGKLVSDPRLYDGLLDLSKSLKSTTDDLDFLLKKWKDEGVNLKLK